MGDKKKRTSNNQKTGGEGHSKCNTQVIDSFSHVIISGVPAVVCRNTGTPRQPWRALSIEMTQLRHPFENERLRPLHSCCFVVSSCGGAA